MRARSSPGVRGEFRGGSRCHLSCRITRSIVRFLDVLLVRQTHMFLGDGVLQIDDALGSVIRATPLMCEFAQLGAYVGTTTVTPHTAPLFKQPILLVSV